MVFLQLDRQLSLVLFKNVSSLRPLSYMNTVQTQYQIKQEETAENCDYGISNEMGLSV
jgi:hypothetical protein